MKKYVTILVFCFLITISNLINVHAQSSAQYPNWTHYKMENTGLGNSHVNAIAIDSSGNQWYATNGGIAEYNGSVWKVYTMSDYGVQSSNISKISFDSKGNLWAVAPGFGIIKFDGTTWVNYNIIKFKTTH